jgi:phage tail protein X
MAIVWLLERIGEVFAPLRPITAEVAAVRMARPWRFAKKEHLVKITISMLVLAAFMVGGCETNRPTNDSALDLSGNAPTPVASAQPASVAPSAYPMTTAAPEPATGTINAAVAPASNTYTIKHGDTLWKIAASHYGDGKKWKQIADANPGIAPSSLRVGQTITLP